MRIVRSVLSPDLTRCPIETRRKKKFRKRRKNKKRGWNRWKFFPYLFLLLLLACAVSVCWCPSFSDYRRSMRVSTCVCVCIIALSHGLTWFLNERRRGPPPFLLLWLKFVKVLSDLFREIFINFFVGQRVGWLASVYSITPSRSLSERCVFRNLTQRPFSLTLFGFFFLSRLVM